MSAEPKNLKQALDDIRADLSPLRKDGNLYDELVDLRNDERRAEMKEFTLSELYDMRDAAYEAYENALDEQMLDDEEHDKIVELRGDIENLEEEIAGRKTEQG